MKQKIIKYGLGVFVASPALPWDLRTSFDVTAPAGVTVSKSANSAIIAVPDGFVSDEPIRIDAIGTVTVVMTVGAHADVRVTESSSGDGREFTLDLQVGPSARLRWLALQEDWQGGPDFAVRRARVAADATLEWFHAHLGRAFARSSTVTRLEGESASVKATGVFFGTGNQQFDLHQEAHHLAPRTTSEFRTHGALDGTAKAVVRDLIRMDEGTSAARGRQKTESLLLSPKAEVDAMPMLEIAHHDVSCSHGATMGRLDEEKLFYLMSRGLPREEAARLAVEGFFAPAFAAIGDAALEERLLADIVDRLA